MKRVNHKYEKIDSNQEPEIEKIGGSQPMVIEKEQIEKNGEEKCENEEDVELPMDLSMQALNFTFDETIFDKEFNIPE